MARNITGLKLRPFVAEGKCGTEMTYLVNGKNASARVWWVMHDPAVAMAWLCDLPA
jgi:hypothetical protein